MAFQVSLAEAAEMVEVCLRNKIMPMVTGSPGCGKSSMLQSVAQMFNLKVIDLRLAQCDPTDLLGFPNVNGERAAYMPMDTFPLEGDPVPKGYAGWMLLLDEMNSADRDVQKAAYKLIYDRQIGTHNLHEKCVIAAAGNLDTDNAIVEELSTALQSRMTHIEVSMDLDQKNNEANGGWLEWAAEAGLDHRILSFIRFEPDLLFSFNPDHDDKTFACPRTWQFASRLINGKDKLSRIDRALLAGTVGEGVGRQFATFCEIYENLPTMTQIARDPETIPVPTEPSILFALSGALGKNIQGSNAGNLMKFINRMPKEFQVITLRDSVRRDNAMKKDPAVQQWVMENATELF